MELITIHGRQLHFKTAVSLQVCHWVTQYTLIMLDTTLSESHTDDVLCPRCIPEKVGVYQKGINKK